MAGEIGRMVRLRVRIRFSKQGDLRLIGHRDLMRCFERLFRRAGLALSFSQGFHPKPRVTFPLALAVGIEGLDEVMELELAEEVAANELFERLSSHAPRGLTFHKVELLPEGAKKAGVHGVAYDVTIPPEDRADLNERVKRLLAASSWPIERARGRPTIDVRPLLAKLTFDEGVLRMQLHVDSRGSVGPREVLAALNLADIERRGARLRRTAVEICA